MIVLFPPESCSHELNIASVRHSDGVHVLIHEHVFVGILLSLILISEQISAIRLLCDYITQLRIRLTNAILSYVSATVIILEFTTQCNIRLHDPFVY